MLNGSSPAAKDKFILLSEEQNAAFDTEFHTPEELEAKFVLLEEFSKNKSFDILDLGGGNGWFVDQLLSRFPKSSATIVDVSALLLAKNKLSDRKELIHGAIEQISELLGGRTFDYITVNWVFHHLVGNTYQGCWRNCIHVLLQCKMLLRPEGKLIVAENMFDGYLKSNLPSYIIYGITAIRWPWFVRLAKRFFNTAGVGVCFHSRRTWQQMFSEAGFEVAAFQRGLVWWWLGRSFRGIAINLLFVKSVAHGHFYLKPKQLR